MTMSELEALLACHSSDDRMLSHKDLHRIAVLAKEQQTEIERLRAELAKYNCCKCGKRIVPQNDWYCECTIGETGLLVFNKEVSDETN